MIWLKMYTEADADDTGVKQNAANAGITNSPAKFESCRHNMPSCFTIKNLAELILPSMAYYAMIHGM